MSSRSNRRVNQSGFLATTNPEALMVIVGVGAVVLIGGLAWVCLHTANLFATTPQQMPLNPVELVLGLVTGAVQWTGAATGILIGLPVCVAVIIGIVRWATRARRRERTSVDETASRMAAPTELRPYTRKGAMETAERFGLDEPGLSLGTVVPHGPELFCPWEQTVAVIAGTRRGKSACYAIPAVVTAPGAVVATSNKRDLVDATRKVRSKDDRPVWVFDPQGVADEEPTWYWDPLTYVPDEIRAHKMAEHFAREARSTSSQATDPYFEGAGKSLVGNYLLAAALDHRPITQVYLWTTQPNDREPEDILARHQYVLQAHDVAGAISAPDKQRAGIFGMAQQMLYCLTSRRIAPWITRTGPDDDRPQFDPREFVRGNGTLYSLSREGMGSAGPLVTALTVAVADAGEEYATRSRGGRLPIPMPLVLDEVTNICKWGELPDLYSHYGSRGIILMTFMQTWAQGVSTWGREGMETLWSAANVRLYLGGTVQDDFLRGLSAVIGDYDRRTVSVSLGKGGRSTSLGYQSQALLDVASLAALPMGRAVFMASGAPAALVAPQPWMKASYAPDIIASIKECDPQGYDEEQWVQPTPDDTTTPQESV